VNASTDDPVGARLLVGGDDAELKAVLEMAQTAAPMRRRDAQVARWSPRVQAALTRRPAEWSLTTRMSWLSWSLYITSMLTPASAIRWEIAPS